MPPPRRYQALRDSSLGAIAHDYETEALGASQRYAARLSSAQHTLHRKLENVEARREAAVTRIRGERDATMPTQPR